jgi:hypothetical protein
MTTSLAPRGDPRLADTARATRDAWNEPTEQHPVDWRPGRPGDEKSAAGWVAMALFAVVVVGAVLVYRWLVGGVP